MALVFITGLGRSGTHLVADIIGSGIPCDQEVQPQFNMVINAVVYHKPIAPLIKIYKTKPENYATKDHPVIWLVEQFRFMQPKFVCIERDVLQVVASSLKHPGVLKWVTQEYPPNPLSANYVSGYDKMDTIERLTARWVVNHLRINELKRTNQGDILFLDYNDLVVNPGPTIHQLELFLEVKLQIPKISKVPMTKYLNEMTGEQIGKIQKTVNDLSRLPS